MLHRLLHGHVETISGTVYGTIVVLSMLVAGARDYESDPWRLVVIVAAGATVLWAAHVYAHGLGESVRADRRLTLDQLLTLAVREGAILFAAALPVAAIALGALSVLSLELALWLAVGIGVATLAIQAVRYARLEHLGPAGAAAVIALNVSLGLVFVGLKALFAH